MSDSSKEKDSGCQIVKLLKLTPNAKVPAFQTPGSAGMDLHSTEEVTIKANGGRLAVGTGLAIQLPVGYEAQIRSRSGLAIKEGIVCVNSPGTIDSDYRQEMKVLLINHSNNDYIIQEGDRIAQMVIARYERPVFVEVDSLDSTERKGGFGSTGLR